MNVLSVSCFYVHGGGSMTIGERVVEEETHFYVFTFYEFGIRIPSESLPTRNPPLSLLVGSWF